MSYQYGMQNNTGLPPKAVQGVVGVSPDFPVVGNGLGGLPVRAPKAAPPRAIIVYGNSGISVYSGTTLENITSTFVSNPTLVATAGGSERLNVTSNNRYLGFGSWARSPNLKGAVADTSTLPWTFYSNFTGLALPFDGNDSVIRLAPSTNGLFVVGNSGNGTDEGVFSFTSPSTEYTGQPTAFTTTIPWSTDTVTVTIGDIAWIVSGTSWYKFTFTTQTLAYIGVTDVSPAYASSRISFNSTNTIALVNSGNTLYKVDISSGTPVFVASYATGISGVTTRSAALSPDGTKAICACSGGKVFLYTFATGALKELRTPAGTPVENWDDVDFFNDGDTYVVTGIAGTLTTHLGQITSGGYVKSFGAPNSTGYNILCLNPIVQSG